MIFQETLDWILNVSPHTGQPKTSTLRILKDQQAFSSLFDDRVMNVCTLRELTAETLIRFRHRCFRVSSGDNKPDVYRVGATRAVQPGRGKPAEGRILIESIKFASPATLTDLELQAEGFDTRERFEAVWERLHGADKLDMPCWLIEFRKVGA